MRKLLFVFVLLVSVFVVRAAKAQGSIDGQYSVGKTSVTIEWDVSERVYKGYWKDGTGFTYLTFAEPYPNGNYVCDEYESDFTTYTGTFTFKDDTYTNGEYKRSDGKKFSVKRIR
jgi:hypothetical protein